MDHRNLILTIFTVANGLIDVTPERTLKWRILLSRHFHDVHTTFALVEHQKVLFKYELFSSTNYPTWPIKLPFFKCKKNNVTAMQNIIFDTITYMRCSINHLKSTAFMKSIIFLNAAHRFSILY
jgi:hypothetical protein